MFHYMTSAEYVKRIEDGLLEQLKRVSSSKEAAAELIDSLGIRHLLVPINKNKRNASNNKATSKKNQTK